MRTLKSIFDPPLKVWMAYLLWLIGGCGMLGLHRFYLRKFITGFLYLITFGFFGFGCLIDFFTLFWQVDSFNYRFERMSRKPVSSQVHDLLALDRAIFETARSNRGRVTPGLVVAENPLLGVGVEQVQDRLDYFVTRNIAVLDRLRDEIHIYRFPEFEA